jgi:rhodanese-related sulfurtransferase
MHPHEIPTVDPREVVDEVLLDVREPDEWAAGRAPNAVHIPLYELPERFGEIPAGRPLSVVCRVGARSAQATAWLLAQGVDARNVAGGMLAWAALGLPVEGDAERAWIV